MTKISRTVVPVLFGVWLLGGCARGISGTYTGKLLFVDVTTDFRSDGKVYITTPFSGTTETTYTKDGDKVTIADFGKDEHNLILTVEPDGSLGGGPMGMVLQKKQ